MRLLFDTVKWKPAVLAIPTRGTTKEKGSIALPVLLASGEGTSVEFKHCLLKDVEGTKGRRELRKEVAKTIAAFMNTRGGTLLIGVSDDGRPVGIEDDLKELPPDRRNVDQYALNIRNVINDHLGTEYSPLVEISFDESAGCTVCIVTVTRSREPAYFRDQAEAFYIRTGGATSILDVKAAVRYIEQNFGRR